MEHLKKAKIETPEFNIIRSLYFEKENKNILQEVLEYLDKVARYSILYSIDKFDMCLDCGVDCTKKECPHTVCFLNHGESDFTTDRMCDDCYIKHLKSTTLLDTIVRISDKVYFFTIVHKCEKNVLCSSIRVQMNEEEIKLHKPKSSDRASDFIEDRKLLACFSLGKCFVTTESFYNKF